MEYTNDSEKYYRKLCQKLGRQLQDSNNRQRASLREVHRSKVVSALMKRLFKLKASKLSVEQMAERLLLSFCNHLSLECGALYTKSTQTGGFTTLAHVGFAISESCDLSRKKAMPEFVFVDSNDKNLGISRILQNFTNSDKTVWCFHQSSGLAFLLGSANTEQSSGWDLSKDDREMLHSILELIANVVNEASTRNRVKNNLLDDLTGVANRSMVVDQLERDSRQEGRESILHTAVLYLDIDNFQKINQEFGHVMGDKVLVAVAHKLKSVLRPGDLLGRIGVDEFAILAPGQRIEVDAVLIADRILKQFRKPLRVGGHSFYVSWSIGIAEPLPQQSAIETLRDANLAMFNAKTNGGARSVIYGSEMRAPYTDSFSLESDLRLAIERQELSLYYQPIFSVQSNAVVAFEALLRWHHPKKGILLPKDFMDLAEQSEIALRLGDWVVDRVVRDMNIWSSESHANSSISVCINIDEAQFVQASFVSKLGDNLRRGNIDPQRIRLEISERTLQSCQSIEKHVLTNLSAMGVKIMLDDFGSAASSLQRLQDLPIDTIKIDRNFIDKLTLGGKNGAIIKAMVGLAKNLDKQIVATGAERGAQLNQLKQLGCDFVQGYLLCKPMAASRVGEFMGNQEVAIGRQ